jgi:hypothetical protein
LAQQFFGTVNDVAIYNYALSATQVTNHYLAAGIAPRFTLQPPATTNVNEGTTLSVPAQAIGSLPLSYQWYADGAPLQDGTNRTLTFNPVYTGSQGSNFRLVVSNDSGSVTSQVAVLTIVSTNQPVVTTPLIVNGFRGVPLTNSISRLLQLNASDPDGDLVTFTSADSTGTNTASLSTITQSGAYLVYSCDPAFVGQDSYNVYVSDGQGGDAVLPVLVQISDLELRISQGPANTVRLAWPAAATAQGFQLYSATTVTGPYTNAVAGTAIGEGTESALYVTPASGALFYQLAH